MRLKKALTVKGYAAVDVSGNLKLKNRGLMRQILIQFVAGYHNLDFRDTAGVGHGMMIVRHGFKKTKKKWFDRMLEGKLIGIAATEPRGGTSIRSITTKAQKLSGARWRLYGEKKFVSRIDEADAFVVMCMIRGKLAAVIIDANSTGIIRENLEPTGLYGWSWGGLRFENVTFENSDILLDPQRGHQVFSEHFAYYRPLVAATSLGSTAAVHDHVQTNLLMRKQIGTIQRFRDTALVEIGMSWQEILGAMLSTLAAANLIETNSDLSRIWSMCVKANGVGKALEIVRTLGLLKGARSVERDSLIEKAMRDLEAYQRADGLHSELFRAAGRGLMAMPK